MEDQVLKSGWKRLSSDNGNDYLYKAYRVHNLADGLKLLTTAAAVITKEAMDKTSHLSVDATAVTISLNSPSEHQLKDAHLKLALDVDASLKK